MFHLQLSLEQPGSSRLNILPSIHTPLDLGSLIFGFHTPQLIVLTIFFFFNAFITSLSCSSFHGISKLLLTAPVTVDFSFILIFYPSSVWQCSQRCTWICRCLYSCLFYWECLLSSSTLTCILYIILSPTHVLST